MAEKRKASKISLESSKKLISCNVCTLKLPNFFTLPEYRGKDFDVDSPSFELENADWCFRFYSSIKAKYRNEKSTLLQVHLKRLKPEEKIQKLFYKITLLDAKDKKYVNYSQTELNVCYFSHTCNRSFLTSFDNEIDPSVGCDTLTLVVHLFQFEYSQVERKQALWIQESPEKQAVDTNDCKISLKLSKKTLSSDVYTLIFPNFLAFLEDKEEGFDRRSSTFKFENATWCFRFYKDSVLRGGCYFDLERINSVKPLHIIFMKCIISHKYSRLLFLKYNDQTNRKNILCGNYISDESGSLTLTIHLLCNEALKEDADPVLNTMDRDSNSLSEDLKKLFVNGKNYDLTLTVGKKQFRVHQNILMARSQVFEAMLTHDMIEKNKGVVDVPDCDPQSFEQLLIYVYSGKVETLNQDNVLGLYYAADKYNMTLLKEKCTQFMKESLSPSIICDVIQLALNHSDTTLLECATDYFVNNISDILPTVGWMSFMKSNSIAANELLIKAVRK